MKYRDIVKIVEAAGWRLHHQSGSHMVFRHPAKTGTVVVAGGGKASRDVPNGTEQAILKQAGLK